MLEKVLKHFSLSKKALVFLGILFLLLLSIRFLWLGQFPVGLNHDETEVTLSAKSYWKFGTDLSGVVFPQSLVFSKTDAGLSGLPSFLLTPFIGPFKMSLFSVRLPFVFIGLLTSVFLAALLWETTKNEKLTLISFFVSLANPWLFLYSRSPTEAPFALLFCLIGAFLFIRKNTNLFYSFIFFILAFFSYQGAKATVPIFVVLLLIFFKKFTEKKARKKYFIYTAIVLGTVLVYLWSSTAGGSSTFKSRENELIFADLTRYTKQVDEERRASITFPLKNLVFNKYTAVFQEGVVRYFGFLSSDFLFFKGDAFVPFQEQGVLLTVDVVFLFLGLITFREIGKKDKKLLFLLVSLIVAAPAASAISRIGSQYVFRSFLLLPVFIILISGGIYSVLDWFKWNKWATIAITLLYFAFFANFLVFFFFRYSVKQQHNNFLEERVLSNYLTRAKNLSQIRVTSDFPNRFFYEYTFFSNLLDASNVLPPVNASSYHVGNIVISENCPTNYEDSVSIVKQLLNCDRPEAPFVTIQDQKDAGVMYKIFADKLCEGVELNPYRRDHLISDYDIEKMDNETFCKRWINN